MKKKSFIFNSLVITNHLSIDIFVNSAQFNFFASLVNTYTAVTETQESAIPAKPILQCENNMYNSSVFSIETVIIPIIPIVQSPDRCFDQCGDARGQKRGTSW